MPKSRKNMFLQAIADGSVVGLPNAVTREEKFLRGIVTGDNKLQPITRREQILSKISIGGNDGGEFDAYNLIKSNYRLPLVYIKFLKHNDYIVFDRDGALSLIAFTGSISWSSGDKYYLITTSDFTEWVWNGISFSERRTISNSAHLGLVRTRDMFELSSDLTVVAPGDFPIEGIYKDNVSNADILLDVFK